jgi:hypothetical protein
MPGHREEYLSDAPPAEREASGSPLKGGGNYMRMFPLGNSFSIAGDNFLDAR